MKTMQWGILGCGGIANMFAKGLRALPEGHLLAGASHTPGRAAEFAKKHGMERSYTQYDELLADPEIDAIYVATTHNFHYENVKRCLERGKHVLCEKPFTINALQAQELVDLAKQNNCFLMEALWTRFLPAIVKLQELLAEGVIGEVRAVRADFCAAGNFDKNHRMRNKALAGGALLDLGVYPISFADIVFDAIPERIQSSAFIGDTEVDDRSFYLLDYPGGRYAQLCSSFTHRAPNDAWVHGTEGFIRVPQFWMTQGLEIHRTGSELEWISKPFGEGEGFKFEIAHAMKCIQAGKLESDIHPLSKTLSIMRIMDELREQWGLVYSNEK
ncbi:MAG: Gfo/Idh/MocA family oxidoreductase [Pontiella sp.]